MIPVRSDVKVWIWTGHTDMKGANGSGRKLSFSSADTSLTTGRVVPCTLGLTTVSSEILS